MKDSFKNLGIQPSFIKSIHELGIKIPTEIQKTAIPLLLNSTTDLVGQAQTGTGKTAAYGLPLLHKMDPSRHAIQGLILCPTRELSQQVAKQLFKYTKYSDKIFTEAVFGGAHIDGQIANLRRTTHIIVATPGRLIDLVKRKAVDLSAVKIVILDEADEMLSMGFKKELHQILKFVSSAESKWLFSATIPQGIRQIIDEYLEEGAHKIAINAKETVNKNIQHQYVICGSHDKLQMLLYFLKNQKKQKGIIFCKTKQACQTLAKQLEAKNVATGAIHGDLTQKERDKVMRAFKNNASYVLVATDIAARGIDIENVSFVLHYNLPEKDEYYTHRSGRTARAGKTGVSLCFVESSEVKQIRFFERKLGIAFHQIK